MADPKRPDGFTPPPKTGPNLGYGVGPQQARAELHKTFDLACRRFTDDRMRRAIAVDDQTAWEFMHWLREVELRAAEDRKAGLLQTKEGATSDGVPLSRALRLTVELPLLLRHIKENPEEVLAAVDKGLPLVV